MLCLCVGACGWCFGIGFLPVCLFPLFLACLVADLFAGHVAPCLVSFVVWLSRLPIGSLSALVCSYDVLTAEVAHANIEEQEARASTLRQRKRWSRVLNCVCMMHARANVSSCMTHAEGRTLLCLCCVRRFRVRYSPLMRVEFARVCLDEAQMVEGACAAAVMARSVSSA